MTLLPSVAQAEERLTFLLAPSTAPAPAPKLAAQYQLKLRLPQGRGLARLLLDSGVDRDDAAAAALLSAGHLGDGEGGCDVQVSISRAADGTGSRLVRVMLVTGTARTVIERRGAELTIASYKAAGNLLSLV